MKVNYKVYKLWLNKLKGSRNFELATCVTLEDLSFSIIYS